MREVEIQTDELCPFPLLNPEQESQERLHARYVLLLPFTHEDASWFATHQQVTRHNYLVVDKAVTQLSADPELAYTAEATWTIREFLDMAPSAQRENLLTLAAEQRLELSPLYALLDERLAGEQTNIFNFLIARRVLSRYGLAPAAIAPVSDMFGQSRQLPQLLRHFGIDNIMYTRGDVPETSEAVVNKWQAPDESWVYAIRQMGYCSGNRLGHGEVEASSTPYRRPQQNMPEQRKIAAINKLKAYDEDYAELYERIDLPVYGLYNGCDYEPLQDDLIDVVNDLQETFPDTLFFITTMSQFAAAVRGVPDEKLTTYQGDLLGEGAATIRGVTLTRIPQIKIPYEQATRALTEAESFAAFASLNTTMPDARPYLTLGWEKTLITGSHDSLSASVEKEVAEESRKLLIDPQTGAVGIATRITKEALGYSAENREWRYNSERFPADAYSLVNPSAHDRTEIVELLLPSSLAESSLAVSIDGVPQPAQVIEKDGNTYAATVATVPGFGARQVQLETMTGDKKAEKSAPHDSIENELLRVQAENGMIFLEDKRDPSRRARLSFDLFRDSGDSYTLDPLDHVPWQSRTDQTVQTLITRSVAGPVFSELEIMMSHAFPSYLGEQRNTFSGTESDLQVMTRIRLGSGMERADCYFTIGNQGVSDFILRAVIQTENPGQKILARENYFFSRTEASEPYTSWFDRLRTHREMVNCVQAGATTLFTRGLHAYYAEQHRDTTELAIPLLRGIGYISRSDLRHRPGAAAREAAIPDAQCHGTSHMEIALSLSTEGRTPNQLARLADDFRYGTTVGPKGVDLSHVPKLEGDIVLLGAKVAEDGNGIIYQLVNYNPTPEAVYFDRQVQQCFLSEAPVTPDRLDHLVIRPHQLTAVRI